MLTLEKLAGILRALFSALVGFLICLGVLGAYLWHKYAHAEAAIPRDELWLLGLFMLVGVTLLAGQVVVAFLIDQLIKILRIVLEAWKGRGQPPPAGGAES